MIPRVYSSSTYFWDFVLEFLVRLVYVGLDFHACSNGFFFRGNAQFAVVTWISYSLSSRNKVLAMGDLVHACCLSLGRCSEPSYLVDMVYLAYLARPW